jgi:hypothetical protein
VRLAVSGHPGLGRGGALLGLSRRLLVLCGQLERLRAAGGDAGDLGGGCLVGGLDACVGGADLCGAILADARGLSLRFRQGPLLSLLAACGLGKFLDRSASGSLDVISQFPETSSYAAHGGLLGVVQAGEVDVFQIFGNDVFQRVKPPDDRMSSASFSWSWWSMRLPLARLQGSHRTWRFQGTVSPSSLQGMM